MRRSGISNARASDFAAGDRRFMVAAQRREEFFGFDKTIDICLRSWYTGKEQFIGYLIKDF